MQTKRKIQSDGIRLLEVVVGSFGLAFTMNFFMEGVGLLPGGFTGLSKLLQRSLQVFFHQNVPFSFFNIILNTLPALYAVMNIGKRFVLFSVLTILISGLFVDFLPVLPITMDPVLVVTIGGFLYGLSLALVLNANASSGGTDFIAVTLSNKYNVSFWNYVLVFNAVLFAVSAFLFNVDAALYSILFQAVSTKVVNRFHRRFIRKTAFIVTSHGEELAQKIMARTHHGITLIDGRSVYSGERKQIIYSVIGKKDAMMLHQQLHEMEPDAFMNITDSEEINGRFYLEPMD